MRQHEAPHRQRHRYESMLFMRSVGPNPQAGPLWKREEYKPSANALVSLQQDQGKGVPQNSITFEDKTAQHIGSYSPTTFGVVEFQLSAAFLIIFFFDMDRKLNMVELPTLERFSTGESGNQKSGKTIGGWKNCKNGQRQIHVQTSARKPVADEF